MKDNSGWVVAAHLGSGWDGDVVYVNPNEEMAKVRSYMITHWGYHDESETEETWSMIPIEKAIRMVYPNEKAIRIILENTKQDHTQLLKELSEMHKKA